MKKWVVTATILMLLMWTLPLFYWDWSTHKKYFDLLTEKNVLLTELEDLNEVLYDISIVDVGYYRPSGEIIIVFGFGSGYVSESFVPLIRTHWYSYPHENYYNITFELEFIRKDAITKRLGICNLRLIFYWKLNDTWNNITVINYSPDQLYTLGERSIIIPFAQYYAFQLIVKNIEEDAIVVASGVLFNSTEMEDYASKIKELTDKINKIYDRLKSIKIFDKELEVESKIIGFLVVATIIYVFTLGVIGFSIIKEIYDYRKEIGVLALMTVLAISTPWAVLLTLSVLITLIALIFLIYVFVYALVIEED